MESAECALSTDQARLAEDDPEDPGALVSFTAPPAVKAAFEEALLLHRAVCGREESVTSFVEALVAESFAGPHPPDAVEIALRPGASLALREDAMSRATGNWCALASRNGARDGDSEEGLSRIGSTLADLNALAARAGTGDAADLDGQMRALLALEDRIDRELGRVLAEMSARGAWARLLFSGAGHYGEERLRLARTTAEGRAQVARALRTHPTLSRAYENGEVGIEAALILLRILGRHGVDEQLEQSWVERAMEATVRRLRDEARALGFRKVVAGGGGSDGGAGDLGRPVEAADIDSSAKGEGTFAEMLAVGEVPFPQTDAEWYASLRRRPGDFHDRVRLLGRIAAASPLCEIMRLRLPEETASGLLSAIESTRRKLEAQVESVPWPDPAAPGSIFAARTFSIRCRRVPSWAGFLALVEDYVRTWDASGSGVWEIFDSNASSNGSGRSGHSHMRGAVPKRKGDRTYIREGWRCAAPGCTSRANLEEHHIAYRSRGGGNEMSNLICACRFHHQEGEHRGLASCRGRAPLGIEWRLGVRGIGGLYRNDRKVSGGKEARRVNALGGS